jgi:protein FrlC
MLEQITGMNITYSRYSFEFFLHSMNRLGITSIELWGGAPHFYIEDLNHFKTNQFLKKIRANELNIVCFTPEQCMYPINLASVDETEGKRSLEYFSKCIDICHTLEVSKMVVTPGYGCYDQDREEAWKNCRERLFQLSKIAESTGVTLLLEPLSFYETNIVKDLPSLKLMLQEVDSSHLKPMVDTVAMYLEKETLDQYFTEFGKDLIHIHLVDSVQNSFDHLSWGEGTQSLPDHLQSIKQFGYKGPLTLELISADYILDPEAAMKQSVKQITNLL